MHKMYRQLLFDLAMGSVMVAELEPGGGMTYQVLATLLELRSEKQPNVVRMTCANWGLLQDLARLTLGQIRESLGNGMKTFKIYEERSFLQSWAAPGAS